MQGPESQQEGSRYVVGIDLGTTNSAVGYIDTLGTSWQIRTLAIPQLVAPGEVEARETLPSFHYEAVADEFPKGALRLSWDVSEPRYAVGVFARDHGTTVPGRLIASVKSWLCHAGVDRTAAILPWHGAPDVERLSPVQVSSRYLAHLKAAWDAAFPEYPLHLQEVILTVPASFDEVARELTVDAAHRAGLTQVVLLEEPQAAFYAWVHAHQDDWQTIVQPGQTILVCDIGGGTTDFTLIEVSGDGTEGGEVRLQRVAVGDHLILGGDNLDLALAYVLEPRFTGPQGGKLPPRQWDHLVRMCRQIKEDLLGTEPSDRLTLSLPGSGRKLIGGALQTEIERREVEEVLVQGFLPFVGLEAAPRQRRSGFQEFGLPYAAEPAITRHLASFLRAHQLRVASTAEGRDVRPDVILFNGGFFVSPVLRQRMLEVITSWFRDTARDGAWQPLVLQQERLDLAVAHGAAYYGLVRRGYGIRISGGLARSYYIGAEDETTGSEAPIAVCLMPSTVQEGQTIDLSGRPLQLRIRQPVEFPLYTSSLRTHDAPGAVVAVDPNELRSLPPVRTVLTSSRRKNRAEVIPVYLHARLSDIGTLDLWCSETTGDRRWRLQFDARATAGAQVVSASPQTARGNVWRTLDESILQAGCEAIYQTFRSRKAGAEPEGLAKRLEAVTGMRRTEWPSSVLRRFWEALMEVEAGRQFSPAHEARWLNLAGFALRPGYGMAVDDWRVAQTWRLFPGRVKQARHEVCRAEWWILWRRIAGGLEAGQQKALADALIAALRARWSMLTAQQQGRRPVRAAKSAGGDFRFGANESAEVWRLLGSLEWLEPSLKMNLGRLAFDLGLNKGVEAVRDASVWALGRLGNRVPVYGPLNALVPVETVERWVRRLIDLSTDEAFRRRCGELPRSVLFAVVQMTRLTGDRYRDVSDEVREAAQQWLRARQAAAHFVTLVTEGGELQEDEQVLVLSESLLPGLKIA